MYGSSSALPLTISGPVPLHSTVSPPTAMTRLIRSFSSADGISPMKLRPFCTSSGLRGRVVSEPAAGVVEDHDLAARGLGAEPGGQLVDQHPVALLQGVLHRVRGDGERLHQEGLDQQREHQRDADQQRQLLPEGVPAARTPAPCRTPRRTPALRRALALLDARALAPRGARVLRRPRAVGRTRALCRGRGRPRFLGAAGLRPVRARPWISHVCSVVRPLAMVVNPRWYECATQVVPAPPAHARARKLR